MRRNRIEPVSVAAALTALLVLLAAAAEIPAQLPDPENAPVPD